MISLDELTPAETFGDLLRFGNSGGGITPDLQQIGDGLGENTTLYLSTVAAKFTSSLELTGQLLAASGDAAAPGVSIGDADDGIYNGGSFLGVTLNGQQRVGIDTGGYFVGDGSTGFPYQRGINAEATPGWTFTGDLDSGVYWIAADRVGVSVGGAGVAEFSGTGFGLGISPSRFFHVEDTGVDSSQIALIGGGSGVGGASVRIGAVGTSANIDGVNNGVGAFVPLAINGSTVSLGIAGTVALQLDAQGDVGIHGAPTNGGQLEIRNPASPATTLEVLSSSGPRAIMNAQAAGALFGSFSDDDVLFMRNVSEKFRMTATAIQAQAANGAAILNEDATATNPTSLPNKADADTGVGWVSADTLALIAGGSNKMTIDGNTGGTGGTSSAGSGNQYVELTLNGNRYKLLHDGTI